MPRATLRRYAIKILAAAIASVGDSHLREMLRLEVGRVVERHAPPAMVRYGTGDALPLKSFDWRKWDARYSPAV